jgi:hypothetical protein
MVYRKLDPGDFEDGIVADLLEALAQGESLSIICDDRRMPDRRTVQRWMERDDDLAAEIMRAREVGFRTRGERAVADAKEAKDAGLGRLAFDAERWYLGKLSNAFAEKPVVQHQHSGTVKVDADDAFGQLSGALERAATAIAGGARGTSFVDPDGETGANSA